MMKNHAKSEPTRREAMMIGAAAATGLLAAGAGTQAKAAEKGDIPIALQLYSVRHDCARDDGKGLKTVIESLSRMGYDGVEFAGFHGWSPADVRKLLDDNNMKAFSTHTGINQLRGDSLNRVVEEHQIIGAPHAIVPSMPNNLRGDLDAWRRVADIFTEIAQRLEPHGMRTGYHNHNYEFSPLDDQGTTAYDVVFQNTPASVIMQVDMANAMSGNADPADYMRRYPGRGVTLHMKEHRHPNSVIGEGDVNWPEIIKLARTVSGTTCFIVEHEIWRDKTPMEVSELCINNLKRFKAQVTA